MAELRGGHGYGGEFDCPANLGKDKKTLEEELKERRGRDIKRIVAELMHAEKVLTFFGNPTCKAIDRELSQMSEQELKEIVHNLTPEQAKNIKVQMDRAYITGEVVRFKEILDLSVRVA